MAQVIQELGKNARAARDASDLAFLRRLKTVSRAAELAGRAALVLGQGGPLGWFLGMGSVAFHLSIEAQLNHAIMHGAYEGIVGVGRYTSQRYETLAIPFQSRTWRDAHRIHHANPSLLGDDPDTLHPFFRVHSETRWRPWHWLNGWLGTFFVFELWAWDYNRFLKNRGVRAREDRSELHKFLLYVAYQYALFPLLAGARWKEVLVAGILATIMRNFVFVALQTGSSVGQGVSTRHPKAYGRKTPGEWVKFQIETSKNFGLSRFFQILCGGLDRHIEHHLFPNLPAYRLHGLAPQVRELCKKNGIEYEEHASVWASLSDSLRYLWQLRRR